jgi:hypothetical protein
MNKVDFTIKPGDSVETFVKIISEGLRRIVQDGCPMLARLVHNEDNVFSRIRAIDLSIPEAFLAKMLRVGEGGMAPALLVDSKLAFSHLSRLPATLQEKIIDVGAVEVVVSRETGDTINVPIHALTRDQAKQVFTHTGLRGRDEQRAYLCQQSQVAKAAIKRTSSALKWKVQGDVVLITKPCTMTLDRHILATMLQELEKKAA